MIYELYIFNRHCNCIFHTGWNKNKSAPSSSNLNPSADFGTSPSSAVGGSTAIGSLNTNTNKIPSGMAIGKSDQLGTGETSTLAFEEQAKLIYGVVFSLRTMVDKLTVKQEAGVPDPTIPRPPFSVASPSLGMLCFRTNNYKLHYFETASNLKFILMTDPNMDTLAAREVLKYVYEKVFVETVAKNGLAKFDTPISNSLFAQSLNGYIASVPGFST